MDNYEKNYYKKMRKILFNTEKKKNVTTYQIYD